MRIWIVGIGALMLAGCASTPQPQEKAAEAPKTGDVVRLDPALDALIPQDTKVEKVAGGFKFVEGPVWRADGKLWFSDLMDNVVRSLTPDGQVAVMIEQAGGPTNAPPGSYAGPNGMISDKDGTLLLCQHNNRDIVRVSKDLKMTPVVSKYDGKRLNSPNDLVLKSDGSLYFTDPPFGLTKQDDDPAKELKFNGVFRFAKGKAEPIVKDLSRPNGIGFSPDEKTLYVSNCDPKKALWMRYDVAADGSVSNGRVLADATNEKGDGCPDGLKLDAAGNIYATGPGGLWVISPDGKHLGTVKFPENPSNVAWAGDGKTLYITAVTSVYRIKTSTTGEKAPF